MSRAVRIHRAGGPEVLSLDEIEIGPPGPGEVVVRNAAAGVNFIDIHQRAGRYPLPSLPVTLGMEGAGTVESVGEGVSDVSPGDRVAYMLGGHGAVPCAYADRSCVPAERLILLPEEIDDRIAAGLMLKGLTAEYLVHGSYRIRPGDAVVVHAAAGGVGSILCQWARHLGARVIGTVGSREKAALAEANGCHHVILYQEEDVAKRVRTLTAGEGAAVVYDAVGQATFEGSLASLRTHGTLVSYGTASGPIPPFDLFRLNVMGSLHVTSAGLGWFTGSREELLARSSMLLDVVLRGAVTVRLNHTWPLAEAESAHRALEGRGTTGLGVLVM